MENNFGDLRITKSGNQVLIQEFCRLGARDDINPNGEWETIALARMSEKRGRGVVGELTDSEIIEDYKKLGIRW